MRLNLEDRVAFVAGSSRGIGKAIARAFLDEGCRVAISGRSQEALDRAQAEFADLCGPERILALPGDFLEPSVIRPGLASIMERWGRLDCVVANIGTGRGKPGWDLAAEDWSELFNANLWGSAALAREVLPYLVQAGHGSLVFISSIAGLEALPAPLPYSAAKAALVLYSKNLSRSVGAQQVRVNCIAPGNILFPDGSWERHLRERPAEIQNYIESEVPLKRFGRPEEIADLAVFLSSDRASFITGACIVADGGQSRSV